MWQIEFTANVACWYRKMRSNPPQIIASSTTLPGAADEVADAERDAERQHDPDEVEPADMRVHEAAQRTGRAVAMAVRGSGGRRADPRARDASDGR